MRQTELDPLTRQYDTFTQNNLRERRSGRTTPSPPNHHQMHFPQHQPMDPVDDDESVAARAARGGSRQPFYRDRIPQLPSESRDYSRANVPVTSTESSDSSASDHQLGSIHHPQAGSTQHYQQQQFAYDGNLRGPPGMMPMHNTSQMPSPQQMQHDYQMQRQRHSPANPALESTARTHGRFIRTDNGALVEVSEEVYAVRKAALAVLDPITYCWVSIVFTHKTCHAVFLSYLTSNSSINS
jgi:hypothetical protein